MVTQTLLEINLYRARENSAAYTIYVHGYMLKAIYFVCVCVFMHMHAEIWVNMQKYI